MGFECAARRKGGEVIWITENVYTVRDSAGSILQYRGTVQDISARKRSEQQIARQLESLSALRTIDLAIIGSSDVHFMLRTILTEIVRNLHVDAATVMMLNPFTRQLEIAETVGFAATESTVSPIRLGEGLAGRVALERRVGAVPNIPVAVEPVGQDELIHSEGFTATAAVALVSKGQLKGVLQVFSRSSGTFAADWLGFLEVLGDQTAIAIDNVSLFDSLQRSHDEISMAYETTLEGWSAALDLRDRETEGHTRRVAEIAVRLGRAVGLPEDALVHLRRGALLHDIGKMGVPDAILLKPGPLTDVEWAIMRQHPDHAHRMLSPISYLRPALDIPFCHHEKWDGTGYPRGLKAEEIPPAARIFAAVDVYDALRSDRPYRKAWDEQRVREHVQAQSGAHFDPQVVAALLAVDGREMARFYSGRSADSSF